MNPVVSPAESAAIPIIDCDIHPTADKHPVGSYMPAAFQERCARAWEASRDRAT
jgi:hypothetical protein